ncbi:MAG: hypothetical protein FWC79_02890 [Oscillospiraceae bacterium]|nr:hypothetical protein [Oscillospiraceae bacterium]
MAIVTTTKEFTSRGARRKFISIEKSKGNGFRVLKKGKVHRRRCNRGFSPAILNQSIKLWTLTFQYDDCANAAPNTSEPEEKWFYVEGEREEWIEKNPGIIVISTEDKRKRCVGNYWYVKYHVAV